MTTITTVSERPDNATISAITATFASAFVDDPFFRHALGTHFSRADMEARLKHLFHGCVAYVAAQPRDTSPIHVSSDGACATLWLPHDRVDMGGRAGLISLAGIIRCFRGRSLRFMRMAIPIQKAHPKEPHAYLWVIGTAAGAQGKGLGGRVIEEMLQRCDEEGMAAYLESTNSKNVPFYERHGFNVMHNIEGLPKDCPPVVAMWRKPKQKMLAAVVVADSAV